MTTDEHKIKMLEYELGRAKAFHAEAEQKLAAAKDKHLAMIAKAKAEVEKARAELVRVENESIEEMAGYRQVELSNRLWVGREEANLAAHLAANQSSLGFNTP